MIWRHSIKFSLKSFCKWKNYKLLINYFTIAYQSSNHFWTHKMFKFDSSIWNSFSRNTHKKEEYIDWNQFVQCSNRLAIYLNPLLQLRRSRKFFSEMKSWKTRQWIFYKTSRTFRQTEEDVRVAFDGNCNLFSRPGFGAWISK